MENRLRKPHESSLSWSRSLVDRSNFSAPISAIEDATVAKVMDPKYYTDWLRTAIWKDKSRLISSGLAT